MHFIQPDSIIPDLANPQSLNRYSYVTNRPINFNDPTGHRSECGVYVGECKSDSYYAGFYTSRLRDKDREKVDRLMDPKHYLEAAVPGLMVYGTLTIGPSVAQSVSKTIATATEEILWSLQNAVWKAGWVLSDAAEGALVWLLNKIGLNSRAGQVAMSIFDKIGLHNPKSSTMVIGQNPNYVNTAQQNGYAYYQHSPRIYSALERAGWAPTNNANAIINSVQVQRTILIDAPDYYGVGLQFELGILNNLRYPYQWLNGPPSSP